MISNFGQSVHSQGSWGSELEKYADPMLLPSRSRIPKSFSEVLLFCRWLYISNPQFRQAVKRTVSHGVTTLKFRGDNGSPDERRNFERTFRERIGGFRTLRLWGEDFVVYGSAFMRAYYPFNRQLIDRRRGFYPVSLNMFPEELISFDLKTLTYRVPDPRAKGPMSGRPHINLPFRDLRRKTAKGIRFVRLDPRYVKLRYSSWAEDIQVQTSFEPEFKSRVRNGDLFEVNRTPVDVLRAVRDNQDYRFEQGSVFARMNHTISGFLEHGFGLPEMIPAFPHLYKMALYDRQDESISHEMMQPYRFVSPATFPESGELDGAEFRTAIRRAVEEQRADRTHISMIPIPVNFQSVSADGKSLVPKDLKDYELTQLLRSIGIPEELFTGSIQIDKVPYAVRLFEASHADLFEGLSQGATWMVSGASNFLHGVEYDAVLEPSSIADDVNRRVILRDLVGAQEVPRRLLAESLGLEDAVALKEERAEEDLEFQERLAELEEKARRRTELGSIGDLAGAEGGGAAAQAPSTPVDTADRATALAMEWLGLPDGQRRQAMQSVSVQNHQLYLMAKDIMDTARRDGESQGRQMVYQQAQQAAQGGAPQ